MAKKSKKTEIKSEAVWIDTKGRVHESVDKEVTVPETNLPDKRITNVIPLGYGLVAPTISKVSKDEKWGAKKGDLAMSFGWLPEKLETGVALNPEQRKYTEEHPAVNLVMTKEYALRMIQNLILYVNDVL